MTINQTHFYFHTHPHKLIRHTFKLFTFYYTLKDQIYYPIAISKPDSTQPPHYYTTTSPTFTTLNSLLNHYTTHIPLK